MKKMKLLGMLASVAFLVLFGKPMEVQAKEYNWETINDVVGWYEFDMATNTHTHIEGTPTNLTSADGLSIFAPLTSECTEYLNSLSGELSHIGVYITENVTVGNADGSLQSSIIVNNGCNVTFNGQPKDVRVYGGNLIVNGNVNYLWLGNASLDIPEAVGSIVINGNVSNVTWYKKNPEITQDYEYFTGSLNITGTVSGGKIMEAFYDEVLQTNVFAQSGEVGVCEAGNFQIVDGVLADTVTVNPIEVTFSYYNVYQCYGPESGYSANRWVKQFYNVETHEYAAQQECTQADIPVGAEVIIYGTATPVRLDIDLGVLHVMGGEVVFNGNILVYGVVIYILPDEQVCNVTIKNNIDIVDIHYYAETNPNSNIIINGKVTEGTRTYATGTGMYFDGYYSCQNVQLIENGVWNKEVLVKKSLDNDSVAYEVIPEETVIEAVNDASIGQEIVVDAITIVKNVAVTLEQSANDIMENISIQDIFVEVLESLVEELETTTEKRFEATPVCAVDISIDTFYSEKESGNIYTANPNYGSENISELPQGKTLEFTVQIPKNHYKSTSKYEVVRQHENADGSQRMDRLQTTQNGDMLTFASDKFSTFVIVEVTEKEDATPENPPVSSPVTPPTESIQPTGPNAPQTPTQPQTPATSQITTQEEVVEEKATIMYRVQRGDNLYKIARMYGLTLNQLLKLNPEIQNPNLIYAGQMLIVGYEGNSSDLENDTDAKYYIVKRGDNLYRIAAIHNMSLGRLQSMNPQIFKQRYIYAGQKIRIN